MRYDRPFPTLWTNLSSHLKSIFEPNVLWIVADRSQKLFVHAARASNEDNRPAPPGSPDETWKGRRSMQSSPSVNARTFDLLRGEESMIPFIMAVERTPGFETLVGRWDEARHRAALGDGRHAYFVGQVGSEPVGFAILRDWNSPEGVTMIKRIAVCDPGRGIGRSLLSTVVDITFAQTDVWRLWLGVFPKNARARRAYEAIGFKAEGVAHGSAFFGGVHRDELVMALLRPEWQAQCNSRRIVVAN
jgi:RimJ/RimL family protein N-acetyltransferase